MEYIDFLSSAEEMLNKSKDEIDYRNAASRAYYAAYHSCLCLAREENLNEIGSSHDRLVKALTNCLTYRTLGNQLRDCKMKRHQADYKLDKKFSYSQAKSAIKKSKEINQTVTQFLSSKVS